MAAAALREHLVPIWNAENAWSFPYRLEKAYLIKQKQVLKKANI